VSALYPYVSHLLSKKQATLGKTPRVNIPMNNIHLHKTLVTHIINSENLCTADTAKAWDSIRMWKEATQQSYSYSLAGACVHNKTNFTFPPST